MAAGLTQHQGKAFGVSFWSVGHEEMHTLILPPSSPAHPTAFQPRSAAWDALGREMWGQLVLHPPLQDNIYSGL